MSKRQLTAKERKRLSSVFLKEIWLLVENVNGGDGNGPRFEVLCCDPKVAAREGHDIGSGSWLYIQPDGRGTPRLVRVNDLSRGRHIVENFRRMYERDRSRWTTDQEPPTNTIKTIIKTSRHSIRAAKRVLRRKAKRQEFKSHRKAASNEFVLAKRRRSDRTRQFDGTMPSCSGVSRSRQLVTPSPPLPPSTPPQNSSAEVESSYSSDLQSITSSSTDEEERFKRLVKSIARYSGHVGKRSEKSRHSSRRSSQRSHQHHRRRLLMSTPVPGCSHNHDTVKLTFDVATQTDPPMEVEGPEQEEDEEEDMEEEEVDDEEADEQEMEEQEGDDQEMEEQQGEEQEMVEQESEVQEDEDEDDEEQEDEDQEEDPEVVEGRAALIQMGTLIQTITSQFNSLTQSMGLEDMCITMSDLEGDTSESESDSEMNGESNQSGDTVPSPAQEPEAQEPEAQELQGEVVDSPPEPVRRVSPPVQADASPSVPRVPTPQQPVVGFVEQAGGEQQSSNESGDHFVTTSNIMGPGPSGQRMVKVRRVSAHTTNRIERAPGEELVPIGNGRAMVPARLLEEIDWNSYTQATRQLLQAVFPRRVLATHSLTGKPSPAFMNKPPKKRLNPQLVEDVVIVVTLRCGVTERLVRNCITIKCTDEAKLYRNRQQCKQGRLQGSDQENVPPNQTTDETTETSSGES